MKGKYYITDCISGLVDTLHDDEWIETLEEARAIRDQWNREREAEGGSNEFWIIVDRDGNTVQ